MIVANGSRQQTSYDEKTTVYSLNRSRASYCNVRVFSTSAFSKAFGRPTVFIREGGSIPFVRTIADATGKPCLLMGFGQPDENAHAPNEKLDLGNFQGGILSTAFLYEELRNP